MGMGVKERPAHTPLPTAMSRVLSLARQSVQHFPANAKTLDLNGGISCPDTGPRRRLERRSYCAERRYSRGATPYWSRNERVKWAALLKPQEKAISVSV